MANRFDRYVATEYVGMPVDYYQAALAGREEKAKQQIEQQRMQIQMYGEITPIGADAKALQEQLLGGIKERIAGVAKKDLRTADALNQLQGIVNDPQTIMASRNFLQDISEYTKAQKTYEDYVKDNPNDVNALPYIQSMRSLSMQKGDATKYKPGAFSGIGPFTKYYDWKKRYNEIANQIKSSGSYKDKLGGDHIFGHGEEGVPWDQIHSAVMDQLSSDSDAMQQIQREMQYNAYRSNPDNPNEYFKNIQKGDVRTAKSQFDRVMGIKTDFNDPSKDADLRSQFRQRFIDAGYKVPVKKEFDKAYGEYRMNTIKDANDKLFKLHTTVRDIAASDPQSYATNKFVEGAVSGIANTYSTKNIKDTIRPDMTGIARERLAWQKWKYNDQKATLNALIASDNNVRVNQDNLMKRGEPITAWNDPTAFKGTPMEGVQDDGSVKGAVKEDAWYQGWFDSYDEAEAKRKANAATQTPGAIDQQTKTALKYIEDNFGTALGPAPVWDNTPPGIQRGPQDFSQLTPDLKYQTAVKNYLAQGKRFMGDMRMKGQEVAPMVFHMDALSGSGGRPAPLNKTVSENLLTSEHIYTAAGDGDERKELLNANNYIVGTNEKATLQQAIAAQNGVSVITDSRFGNPAFRYELQTKDGPQTVYVEQRPDQGGPISKIMESYQVTSMSHQNTPGAKVVNINTPGGSKPIVIETRAPTRVGEGGRVIYNTDAQGMENSVYTDPNHPILVQYADEAMKNAKLTSKQQLISFVNNAYNQYTKGNPQYQLDPKDNLIHGPGGLVIPPMKYIRVNNENVMGTNKYVLVAPGELTFGKTKIGGSGALDVLDFERAGIKNAIEDPSMQMYRRFPPSVPKRLNTGSYFDLYDEDASDNQDE